MEIGRRLATKCRKKAKGPGFNPGWLGKVISCHVLPLTMSLCSKNPPFLQHPLLKRIHRTQLVFSSESDLDS